MIAHGKLRTVGIVLALAGALACLGIGAAGAQAGDMEILEFQAAGLNQDGTPSTSAGARPWEVTNSFGVNLLANPESGAIFPAENVKDLAFKLPAGLVGNPSAFPQCQESQLNNYLGCPAYTQIGTVTLKIQLVFLSTVTIPVYNMRPPPGMPAQFAFNVGSRVHVNFRIRSGTDYGVTATLRNISNTAPLFYSKFTLWGVPADSSHDSARGGPTTEPRIPLLSNPTNCGGGGVVTEMVANTWQNKEVGVPADAEVPAMTDCDQVDFSPSIEAKPTTNLGDSPTGLEFHLHIPQNEDPDGLAEAHLKEAKVVLPESLTINPSSANGLGSCSLSQVGYTGPSNERQLFHFETPQTRSYTLAFGDQVTAPLPADANITEVTDAAEHLAGAGNVNVTGTPGAWNVEFTGALAGKDIPDKFTGSVVDNAAQIIEVTSEGGYLAGGFNLHYNGYSTEATATSTFRAGDEFVPFENPSRPSGFAIPGTPVEGPGIAPGTRMTTPWSVGGYIYPPAESKQTNVQVNTALPPIATAEEIENALQTIPGLEKGNVFVTPAGSSQFTRTFEVIFAGNLAGTDPPDLTATSSLNGPGAGVVITSQPSEDHPLASSRIGNIAAGTPQFSQSPPDCPDASKIGTVRIDTALINHPLTGNVYLATPHENPFGALLAIYVTVFDPETNVVLKLPGQLELDKATGQVTATLSENPQLPFEDFRLDFFKGSTAPLKTGIACGTSVVNTDMIPRTVPDGAVRHPKDSFTITRGAAAGPCVNDEASAPKAPTFEAGTLEPTAGLYSPFTLKIARLDGTQHLTGVDATLPKGLLARLAGVPYCSDAALAAAAAKTGRQELVAPSCPAASRVGTVEVGAGAGPTPYYVEGSAYLAGPYKGAPLSVAIVTPAVAGPLDVGDVVVRNALHIDPETTQVHVVSDPIPSILQGIPLDLRTILVNLNRGSFTRNPTSCIPQATAGRVDLLTGQAVPVSSPFQVGDCGKLGFKPKLALTVRGNTKRVGNPSLKAVLTPREGDANFSRVSVALPKSELLDNSHIGTVCTRVQFVAHTCPAASIYGFAKATTPLLDNPIEGPVYLRSSSNKLPDLVADLRGQIDIAVVGRIDTTKKGGIRTTFDQIPDAPVSRFVLELEGGKKGLLQNSENLCAHEFKATATFDGQNAKASTQSPVLNAGCKKRARKGAKHRKHGARR